MKKIVTAYLLLALCLAIPAAAFAADGDLAKNVKRLERVSPDYVTDKDIDKKFIEVLNLIEKTKQSSEIYEESKRIAGNAALAQSKYMDSFLYYMLVKSLSQSKAGTAEIDYWLGLLKANNARSPHLLAAQLIRLRQLPKDSPDIHRAALLIIDWVKAQKPDQKLRAPEYWGNILIGHRPRVNFAEGDYLKLYTVATYKDATKTLAGFMDDETYVSLLGRVKEGREDIMNEMVAIYRKAYKKKEAADILYQLAMLKVAAKELPQAKTLLDDAVKLNPEHMVAKKERDRIKLELAYQSLAPAAPALPAAQAITPAVTSGKQEETPGIPEHLNKVEGYLTPMDRMLQEAELHGKSKAELRVMRNEIYAHHGRTFQAPDLQNYFSQRPWYRQNPSYSDSLLTDVDKANVKIIQDFENGMQ
jgi:hypothetical protein